MRGKWAAGIEPRSFTWVYKGILAVSERPGGSTTVHRRVRRDEELLWLKHQGFGRVISILPEMQNLSAYFEHGLTASHYALRGGPQQREVLEACYQDIANSMSSNVVVLLHSDEVSDRLLGVIAGYLVWTKKAPTVPTAVALVERLFKRSIGPEGRTVLFDLPVEVAASRRRGDGDDRMEAEGLAFQRRVADGFLAMAAERRDPWLVVDGTLAVDELAATLWDAVGNLAGPDGLP